VCIYIYIYMNYIILGSISAAVTTPLDVAKTRIMLANRTLLPSELTISTVLYKIYIENNVYGYISS